MFVYFHHIVLISNKIKAQHPITRIIRAIPAIELVLKTYTPSKALTFKTFVVIYRHHFNFSPISSFFVLCLYLFYYVFIYYVVCVQHILWLNSFRYSPIILSSHFCSYPSLHYVNFCLSFLQCDVFLLNIFVPLVFCCCFIYYLFFSLFIHFTDFNPLHIHIHYLPRVWTHL